MTNSNTRLWDEFKVTDPKFCKEFTKTGGFSGTAVSPMYYVKRLTEMFGPVGKGWGFEENQHKVMDIEGSANSKMMVFIQGRVWYRSPEDNEVYFTPYTWGGDFIVTANSRGPVFDDDAFKKASTDSFSKAVTYLGLGADVHLGFFDDNKYIQAAQRRTDQKASTQAAERKVAEPQAPVPAAQAQPQNVQNNGQTQPAPQAEQPKPEATGETVHSITPPLGSVRNRIKQTSLEGLEQLRQWALELYSKEDMEVIESDIGKRSKLLSA